MRRCPPCSCSPTAQVGAGLQRRTRALLDAAFDGGFTDHDFDHALGGWHAFYARLGWERWQGPTYVGRDGERVRTADEDDGIMVRRVGPSAAVPLTAPVTCHARAGDDW